MNKLLFSAVIIFFMIACEQKPMMFRQSDSTVLLHVFS